MSSQSRTLYFRIAAAGLLLNCVQPVGAQQPTTRVEQMEQERVSAAAKPAETEYEKGEDIAKQVQSNFFLRRFSGNPTGWGISTGSLIQGSGFALGPQYKAVGLLRNNLDITLDAVGSTKFYYSYRALLSAKHLFGDRVSIEYLFSRPFSPQITYYGQGNNSSLANETNYRASAVNNDVRFAFKPGRRRTQIGGTVGYNSIRTGTGTSGDTPSIEQVFTPANTPGLGVNTSYLIAGPFVQYDTRDWPGDPHKGTNAIVRYLWLQDHSHDERYSFERLNVLFEQYIPFWNEKRTIALMARGDWSYTKAGGQVPYYLQPTLGGPEDMRGFDRFRFYDNNSMLMTAEYRRQLIPMMSLVVFTDWGKVFNEPGQMAFSNLRGDGGFGFRFNSRGQMFMRVDVGFGADGVKFWWVFSDNFRDRFTKFY